MTIPKKALFVAVPILAVAILQLIGLISGALFGVIVVIAGSLFGLLLLSSLAVVIIELSGFGCPVKCAIADRIGWQYTCGYMDDGDRWKKKEEV